MNTNEFEMINTPYDLETVLCNLFQVNLAFKKWATVTDSSACYLVTVDDNPIGYSPNLETARAEMNSIVHSIWCDNLLKHNAYIFQPVKDELHIIGCSHFVISYDRILAKVKITTVPELLPLKDF